MMRRWQNIVNPTTGSIWVRGPTSAPEKQAGALDRPVKASCQQSSECGVGSFCALECWQGPCERDQVGAFCFLSLLRRPLHFS
jgi:hypothetical protein